MREINGVGIVKETKINQLYLSFVFVWFKFKMSNPLQQSQHDGSLS